MMATLPIIPTETCHGAVGDPGAYQRAGTGPFPVKTGRESNAVGPDGAFLEGLAMRKAACENG